MQVRRVFFFALFSVILLTGLRPVSANRKPPPALNNRVTAFFGRYVAAGDSFSQGFQSCSVDEGRQLQSYPARLSHLMNARFEVPQIRSPGYPVNLEDLSRDAIKWHSWYCAITGCRRSYDSQEGLNNFSLAGEGAQSLIGAAGSADIHHRLILGGDGASQLNQALNRNPSFFSLWIGNKDILGASLHRNAGLLTPLKSFIDAYRTIAGRISQKQSAGITQGVIVGNIPDPADMAYDEGSGAFWDEYSLDSDRQIALADRETIQDRLSKFNREIRIQAAANGWAHADMESLFRDIHRYGYSLKNAASQNTGLSVNSRFTGGFFSLDGIHPGSTGSAVIANYYVDALRARYRKILAKVNEKTAAGEDSLYTNPVDPRPLFDKTWFGRSIMHLLDLFI